MAAKYEKRMATTEMRMVRRAMGVTLVEHRRNWEISEEAKVEPIAMEMKKIGMVEVEGHCQKGHESLEEERGMGN